MTFKKLLEEIQSNIEKIIEEQGWPKVSFVVEPSKPNFGDVTCNAPFLLAKLLKKKPFDISKNISEKYKILPNKLVIKTEAHQSGNLNFFIHWSEFIPIVLKESIKENYGTSRIGKDTKIIVEHTSVNPNKALHIGHLRNLVIGDSIARILQHAGYDVKILNYVDDYGLQIADVLIGIDRYGLEIEKQKGRKIDRRCSEIYQKTNFKFEKESKDVIDDLRKKYLQEIESGKTIIAKKAEKITKEVLDAQLDTCWALNANYDCLNFESQIIHSGLWEKIFDKLKLMKAIEFETQGKNKDCWVIRGTDNEEDKVLIRSNGTATYIAKDIPYATWKLGIIDDPFNYKKFSESQPDKRILYETTLEETSEPKQKFIGKKVITVIDSRQSRLQNIIKKLIDKFDVEPNSYIHLGYETVKLTSETIRQYLALPMEKNEVSMSGRKGVVLYADSVLELLRYNIKEITQKKYSNLEFNQLQETVDPIAVGVIRYEMIKQDLDKIITFDLTKSLSLEGDTAVYIQYAYVRAARILEKAINRNAEIPDENLLIKDSEKNLIKTISLFENKVIDAANNFSPKGISKYCHDLAVSFNGFYEQEKVLDPQNELLTAARLCLVSSFQLTLAKALDLLGIAAPNRM
jgi:arginyl-tRNA synthetase